MGLGSNIAVTVTGASAGVTRRTFGAVAFVGTTPTFSETYRVYDDPVALAADSLAGAAAQAAGAVFFSQDPHATEFVVLHVSALTSPTLGTELTALRQVYDDWYGVVLETRVEADIMILAAWCEANDKIFIAQADDADLLTGVTGNIADEMKTDSLARCGIIYHATDAEYADVAWMAKTLAADPDVQTTLWSYKTLSGVAIDTPTTTEQNAMEADNCNYYAAMGGVGCTAQGVFANGDKIDTRITKDWFKARVTEAVQNYLLAVSNRNEKVPYTDRGIGDLGNLIFKVMKLGEREKPGHFVEGASVLNVPKRADMTSEQIAAREIAYTGSVTLAGALEKVAVTIAVLI